MSAKTSVAQTYTDGPAPSFPGSGETLSAFSEAVYDLGRHRDANALGQTIASVVARTIVCDSAVFVRVEPRAMSFTLSSWPPDRFVGLDHNNAVALHVQDHPLVGHFVGRRDARAWSLDDFVSREAFRHTRLYRTLYRQFGIEFQLAMLVPCPDRAPRVLALHRRDGPFSEHDRHILQLLWPHLTQAVRRSRSANRQPGLPDLDGSSSGRAVLILDRSGQVELCTEQARIWLVRYGVFEVSQRQIRSLTEPVASWVAASLGDRTLHSRGIPDPSGPLIVRRGESYLAMRLVPDHARGQHLILMEEVAMNTPPALLLGLGLTPREAEVLAWIAQGKTNRETALILDTSPRTVQKHLERVFMKLGVESRTGAILKAWQVSRFEDMGARVRPSPSREP